MAITFLTDYTQRRMRQYTSHTHDSSARARCGRFDDTRNGFFRAPATESVSRRDGGIQKSVEYLSPNFIMMMYMYLNEIDLFRLLL